MHTSDVQAPTRPARRTTIFSRTRSLLRRTLVLAMLTLSGISVKAANYVLTYKTGNTTYFLARNGTSGVISTSSFNPTTCIWTCVENTDGTTENTLGTSGNRYIYQTVNGTKYFLNYNLGLTATTANDYCRVRNSDNGVYFRSSTRYILLSTNGTVSYGNNNSTGRVTRYEISSTNVINISTNPTINGDNVLTTTGDHEYTATGAVFRIGYKNYYFNNNQSNYYVDDDGNSITPANATIGSATWNLTTNSYATVNSSGVVNVSSLPESDITLTLTATVPVSGGVPEAPSGTTLTNTKEITIQGTNPSAPAITVNGTSVTMSTSALGTTSIRYTLDGTDPTATTGTIYSGAIDLSSSTTSPVTIKAVTVRNGNTSNVTTEVVTLTLPAPTISVNGDAGTANISAANGATIYYTTDGSDPTTSSTQYTGSLSGLSMMTTIKAIAVKDGWNNSPVASELVTITSNVSGGTVTLFDYEDHNWTYYSGVDESVDGGNYNSSYLGKLYSPNPRNVKITYNGVNGISGSSTTVKVSVDESETSFVYYKTLEQGTTTGEYPYQVISNPFSVRPSTGTSNKVYYGFAGWKIVSGGEYIKNHNNNDVLSLDEEIVFNNLPYSSVNCTSAEIVFETTWKTANRTYVSTNPGSNQTYSTNGDYETNFYVINCGYTRTITTSGPVTIMMVEPDGSADYRNNTFTGGITTNNNGVTKIEFAHWNPGAAVDARGRNLTIGRGMTMNGTRRALYGTNQTSGMNQILKVESGNFSTFTSYNNTPSSITRHWVVLGCDYDRAKGDNTKLTFTQAFTVGASKTLGLSSTDEMCRFYSISGSFMTDIGIEDGAAANSFYIGISGNHNNGHRYFEVQGGEWYANIAGAMGQNHTASAPAFTFRMKGGTIRGSVYGAGAFAPAGGVRRYIITGGNIGGWVAAGCNGIGGNTTQSNNGSTNGDSYVYVGGNAKIGYQNRNINSVAGGNVFGAGRGAPVTSYNVGTINNSNIVVADEAEIENNVYGGGNYGFSLGEANIYITGGTVDGRVFGGANMTKGYSPTIIMSGGIVKDGVYGGCNTEGTINNNVTMNIHGGQVGTSSSTANIHGGGYGSATRVSGNVDLTLGASGQTTPGVTVYGDVYGGSALGYVNGTSANTNYHTYVTLNKGTINGSLYGGGLGDNSTAANVYAPVVVTVNGGSVAGAVFGCNNIYGSPQRAVDVVINATDQTEINNGVKKYALQGVYGGGNLAHYDYDNANYPTVTIYGCGSSIKDVYGGGNAAAVPSTHVTINGGDIDRVFGGGNGESGTPAHIGYKNKTENSTSSAYTANGNVTLDINGGTINQIFGGSNAHGTIKGAIAMDITKSGSCEMHIGEVYGGGNEAAGNAGSITIGCTGGEGEGIGDLYGGANKADVNNSIALSITGGSIQRVFGGNNTSGAISGTIQVSVNWNTTDPCGYNYLGSVFGAGNLAQYTGSPVVNILNGTVTENVYGGGKGDPTDHSKGQVTGNPVVTIGDASRLNNDNVQAVVGGDVYGGGDAGNVVGTPQVNIINKCNTSIANVYGGGNAADVNGTDVNIDGGIITGMVFGGGHGDKNANPQTEANVNGNVAVDITGGSINKVFGGSNSKGAISGSVTINIEKDDNSCEMHITEVYGGGNEAEGNAGEISIGCTGDFENNNEGIGTVYGGANKANVGNSINLTITGGHIDNVYGGNNQSGSINGTVTVNVDWSDALTCGKYLGNVFGGGNLAALAGAATVNIKKGTVSQNVYGGGNQAGVGSATINMTGGSILQGLYGGCNTSGTVGGAISVSLTGGQIGTSSNRADVFGGGLGSATETTGNIGVTLDGTTVYGDLYGGSAFGQVNGSSNTTTLTISTNTLHGTIYGGGKGDHTSLATQQDPDHSNVTATSNGNVAINYNTTNTNLTGLYGGANINGLVIGNIEVNVKGNVGTDADNKINIFGGGLGAPTSTNGSVTVNVGTADGTSAPVVYGDVYGGSALGSVNDAAADLTTINILNGTIHGNIYGGGLGDATVNANGYLDTTQPTVEAIVNGTVHVNIGHETNASSAPTIDGQVFGCNNLAGTPKGNVYVDVYRTAHSGANTYPNPEPTSAASIPVPQTSDFAISAVYGGGNLAHYTTNLEGASTHVHIHNCNNTIQYVYGGGNAANSPATEVIIEGGRFEYVFGGGNGAGTGNPGANVAGNSNVILNGGIINYVFGGSNTLGVVNGTASIDFDESNETNCTRLVKELYGGGNQAPGGSVDLTIPCGVTGLNLVFGGSRNADIGTETLFNGGTKKNVTLTIEGGNLAQVFGGNNQGGTIWGDVILNLTGGTIVDAYGGNNAGGNIKGTITVNVTDAESTTCPLVLTNVFGGGKDAAYTPADATISSPIVNINHIKNGTSISGSVFGGGQGATADVTSNPVVTVGDDNNAHYAVIGGNVYGGGDAAAVTGNTSITMQNANSSAANLFGGGNAAGVSGTASVTLTAGHVTTGIYGGCNASGTVSGAIVVNVNGGTTGTDATHLANVHGGGYGSATATGGDVTVTIGNGTTTPVIWGDVYGGSGFGDVNDPDAQTAQTTKVWLKSGTINGSLYGGGLGQVGDNTTDPVTPDYPAYVNGNVVVIVDGGAVNKTTNNAVTSGAVFGCNNLNGTPKGTVEVTINSTAASTGSGENKVYALQGVYGGGNLANYDPTTPGQYPTVTITGCTTSIKDVYGGGNAAAVPYTSVTVWGGDIDRVFAGGNGESGTPAHVGYKNKDANPSSNSYGAGTASATIYGGTINKVFGGSNANGVIRVSSSISIDKHDDACDMHIGEVYGGGNEADGNAGTISIGCTGGDGEGIGDVYGGANAADVNNSIALTISGGHINRVFGGNNTSGAISGTITVNVDWNGSCTNNYLGSVFGGGNQAPYGSTTDNKGNYPVVNIKKADIAENVFGGGLGATAIVYGNPQVTIGNITTSKTVDITGDVYGGGDAAAVVGTPVVHVINNCDNVIGNVYGGGNAADVSGTDVTIDGGQIGMVFGGGHGDKTTNPEKAANVGGNVSLTVTGGTINKVFGGSNSKGNITGTITLSVDKGDNSCEMHITELYGGGNEAAGNAGTISIGCTGDYENNQEGIGDVYGGANAADVNNSIALNITGGHIGRVFGGNNTSGAISGTITVNVDWNGSCTNNYLGSVFGGGNQAPYGSTTDNKGNYPVVNIKKADIAENVFGGGLGATAIVYGNPQVTIGNLTTSKTVDITGDVYGGGDAAAVVGTPVVHVINNCDNEIGNVYGGGNAADVSGTDVTIDGGQIGMVFGGGHGDKTTNSEKAANVDGNVSLTVTGGTINKVFGGSNSKGNITGTITLSVDKGDNSCEMHITELYGGGNEAAGNAGTISIGCTGDYENNQEGIGDVYGGANAANVNNSIALTISGGHINRVFGGNNTSGSIAGSIQVNVNWNDNSTCGDNYLGSVYGGGNQAAYSNNGNYPEVNIINGTVTNNVFGGGLGQTATVAANPYVHVTGGSIGGNVFGGGDQAAVTGSTNVEINGSNVTVGGKAFGGGNNAGVSVNAVISLASGSVSGGVYGGCNTTGTIGGNTQVNVTGGTVGANAANAHANVHGGGYGQGTAVSGNVTVNIGTQNAATGATIYGDVYGGSAMGTVNTAYNATTHTTYETTTVNLYSGTIDGNVYGGGLGTSTIPAYVYGNAEVYQYGAILISRTQDDPEIAGLKIPVSGMIFGCNNVNGTPKGHVKVVVYKTTGITDNDTQTRSTEAKKATSEESDHTYELLAVFGGGNQAAYEPDSNTESTEVIINGCDEVSIHSVYGGGNAASTPATSVTVSGAYEIEYVFGGGNGAGTGNPGANVGYKAYPESVAGPDQIEQRQSYLYGTGIAQTNIYGGRIHKVFGGSNTKGNVRSSSVAMLDEISDCPLILDGFYGGGKSAYMEGKGDIHLGCVSGLAEIYGGAERANVGSDIVLTLTSGHYNKVYGGNNLSGMVMGSITINIEQTGCLPITIDELFGGGNNAAYSVYGYNSDESIKTSGTQIHHDPVINIRSCQSIGAIYGGGEGINATLAGNPHINVNIVKGWIDGQHQTLNEPQELAEDGVIGTIFGGGKKAKVIGDTYIFIADSTTVEMESLKDLKTRIAAAQGNSIEQSGIVFEVTGSGDTEAISYTKSGQTPVVLEETIKQTVNGATITGNVYGGGSEADITGSSHIKIGPNGDEQQSQGNPAPIRSAQPQQPVEQPTQNAATESQQTRTITPTRL